MIKLSKKLMFSTIAFTGLLALSTTAGAEEITYTVAKNDTLSEISEKYFGSVNFVKQIAEANKIDNHDLIFAGEKLVFDTDAIKNNEVKPVVKETPAVQEEVQPVVEEEVVAEEPVVEEVATPAVQEEVATEETPNYSGTTLWMESTAYSSDPRDTLGGGTITATGQNLLSNPMAVAVDPSVIPLGTWLYIEGYGKAQAVDTGGAIQGNIVDVHFPTYEQTMAWGRRQVKVTILG